MNHDHSMASPKFDEVVHNGKLELGERFVILDFKIPSSLSLTDS